MPKILVTGGAGYVGSVCCAQLLERGHDVVVVDDLSSGFVDALPPAVSFFQVDVGDRKALAEILTRHEIETVFHFAAKALIPESVVNPGAFFDSNVASAIAMLETLRSAGVHKLVFSSSAAVYGSPSIVPIVETCPKNPVNAYGESKLILENILQWYAKAYSWSVVAFRYFNACGATRDLGENHQPETHLIPLILQAAAGERPVFEIYGNDYPTPDGTCVRDFVHVLDIAEAHVLALNSLEVPRFDVYNVGTGTSYSVKEVCRVVETVVGRPLPLKVGPRRLGDPPILCASPQKLMAELHWEPHHSSLPEIIESAWAWMSTRSARAVRKECAAPGERR
jgi:UDP-glucose 4-epimerase